MPTDLVQKWDSETDAKLSRNDAHPSLPPAILPARREHYSYAHEAFITTHFYIFPQRAWESKQT